ncbi:low temperature requirement protein A, partial [Ralstonia pseudosolanacearum]
MRAAGFLRVGLACAWPGGSARGHHRVTNIELFFDLVFVFAVTQLSH